MMHYYDFIPGTAADVCCNTLNGQHLALEITKKRKIQKQEQSPWSHLFGYGDYKTASVL